MQFWFYKITYDTSEKYVKTSNESCEIWLKSDFGNRYEQFSNSYPVWDEHDCVQITEEEYIQAIGTIDLNFKVPAFKNQYYRFNTNKKAI